MKPLDLYKIEPEALPVMHVVARSNHQAAEIFVTWEVSTGRPGRSFSVEVVRIEALGQHEQDQLRSLLSTSSEGIARFDAGVGWTIDSDGWTSFDSSEGGVQ
jgi:hypothetical protein